jgi:hypothetical protein
MNNDKLDRIEIDILLNGDDGSNHITNANDERFNAWDGDDDFAGRMEYINELIDAAYDDSVDVPDGSSRADWWGLADQ